MLRKGSYQDKEIKRKAFFNLINHLQGNLLQSNLFINMTSSDRKMPKASSLSQSLTAVSEGEKPKDIKQMGRKTSRTPLMEIAETPMVGAAKRRQI